MSLLQAAFYVAIGYYLMPHPRDQQPMMQMGYNIEQYLLRTSEFVMYEAAAYQVFQATACMVARDWAHSQGYCFEEYVKAIDVDEETEETEVTQDQVADEEPATESMWADGDVEGSFDDWR